MLSWPSSTLHGRKAVDSFYQPGMFRMIVDRFLRPGEARVMPGSLDTIAFDSEETMRRMSADPERWAVRRSDGLLFALYPDLHDERLAARKETP
jgi:hypothetical protein